MSSHRVITIYLKGSYARGDKDWDRGISVNETNVSVTLADDEYGSNQRCYMRGDIARIEKTGHW